MTTSLAAKLLSDCVTYHTLGECTMKYYSIGDICKSKFWASLELRPNCGFGLFLGKTYNGTKRGIVLSFGIGVFIAHQR
jgi:hypothetical protein